ncbi:MAG: hypothetical protein O2877_02980 [bacterium]|nr:hypothetical protein [bacterium]
MSRIPFYLFRTILVLAAVGLFIFLGWKEYAPSGVLSISKNVSEPSPFLSRVLPDTRAEEIFIDRDGRALRSIVGEPVYFTLLTPREFNEVEVEVSFINEDAPIVELGALVNVEQENYHLLPLQNKLLDELSWEIQREGDVVLYDRHGKYKSIADFLVDAPSLNEIAVYHYPFVREFKIPGYQPVDTMQVVDVSIRGEHEFLTYIENEPLDFTFTYQDMNRALGEDIVTILVFDRDGELVASKAVGDDGDTSRGGRGSAQTNLHVGAELPTGVYKIILKVDRDIFFRKIETRQQKITFLNQLFIGDEVGYQVSPRSSTFYTETKSMMFETQHAEGVQNVVIAGVTVPVSEPFVPARHRVRAPGIVSATVPVGDLVVKGAGHYALSKEMFFNPDPVRLDWDTDLNALGINYVIATYESPEINGDLVKARAVFKTAGLSKVRKAYKFAFSLPGIYDYNGLIQLHETNVELRRDPLTLPSFMAKASNKIGRLLGVKEL